ncbi:hypothetical protein CW304_11765 [Bacillus sp. UFRGS-B20]|nr:hypothetical protein CW304_11765 [Bacillus sp. UFRGS-B20]
MSVEINSFRHYSSLFTVLLMTPEQFPLFFPNFSLQYTFVLPFFPSPLFLYICNPDMIPNEKESSSLPIGMTGTYYTSIMVTSIRTTFLLPIRKKKRYSTIQTRFPFFLLKSFFVLLLSFYLPNSFSNFYTICLFSGQNLRFYFSIWYPNTSACDPFHSRYLTIILLQECFGFR